MPQPKTPRRRFTRKTVVALIVLAGLVGGFAWDGAPLGGFILRQAIRVKFRDVRQVSPHALVEWMADPNRPPPLLVDARPAEQYSVSRIAGSVHIDPAHPDLAPLAHVPRDQPIVAYDAAGVGGTAMVLGLTEAGFSRVSNLEGGLFRWANQGYAVVNDDGPVERVHPVSWGWSRLLKARFRA
jgi:rhodanese-related sulfurtransferase